MAITVADPTAAFGAFLRNQVGDMLFQATWPGSGAQLPAVFWPDLPSWFDGNMPAACLVIRRSGGYARFGKEAFALGDPRHDILAYATTQDEATRIAQTVTVVCKQLIVPEVWENTLLCAANVGGGPTPLPDQQTVWPTCWLSVQLVHGEYPQPAAEV